MDAPLPALFLSHGSPMLMLDDCPARDFLVGLAARLPQRPTAIVVLSAHYDIAHEAAPVTGAIAITSGATPPTIHDFGGFAQQLYEMTYPAPGAPALADKIAALLDANGIAAAPHAQRGFDHGAWVPMKLAYPQADIPMVQVAIDSRRDAAFHYQLGQALAPLRDEGVLIVGSGSLTHNLRQLFAARPSVGTPPPLWVTDFADWVAEKAAQGDTDALLSMMASAPHARDNHPTPDHILPFFAAMGAGGEALTAERLHASTSYAVLAMDAYGFS